MSGSLDVPRPRAGDTPLGQDATHVEQDAPPPHPVSTAWRDTLSRAAETWAMFLGAAIPPSPPD